MDRIPAWDSGGAQDLTVSQTSSNSLDLDSVNSVEQDTCVQEIIDDLLTKVEELTDVSDFAAITDKDVASSDTVDDLLLTDSQGDEPICFPHCPACGVPVPPMLCHYKRTLKHPFKNQWLWRSKCRRKSCLKFFGPHYLFAKKEGRFMLHYEDRNYVTLPFFSKANLDIPSSEYSHFLSMGSSPAPNLVLSPAKSPRTYPVRAASPKSAQKSVSRNSSPVRFHNQGPIRLKLSLSRTKHPVQIKEENREPEPDTVTDVVSEAMDMQLAQAEAPPEGSSSEEVPQANVSLESSVSDISDGCKETLSLKGRRQKRTLQLLIAAEQHREKLRKLKEEPGETEVDVSQYVSTASTSASSGPKPSSRSRSSSRKSNAVEPPNKRPRMGRGVCSTEIDCKPSAESGVDDATSIIRDIWKGCSFETAPSKQLHLCSVVLLKTIEREKMLKEQNTKLVGLLKQAQKMIGEFKETATFESLRIRDDLTMTCGEMRHFHSELINDAELTKCNLEEQRSTVCSKVNDLDVDNRKLKGELALCKKKMGVLESQANFYHREVSEKDRLVILAKAQKAEIQKKLDDKLFLSKNQKCGNCEAFANVRKFLEEQNSEKNTLVDKLQKERHEMNRKLEKAERMSQILQKQSERSDFEAKYYKTEHEKATKEVARLKKQLKQLESAGTSPRIESNDKVNGILTPADTISTPSSKDDSPPACSKTTASPLYDGQPGVSGDHSQRQQRSSVGSHSKDKDHRTSKHEHLAKKTSRVPETVIRTGVKSVERVLTPPPPAPSLAVSSPKDSGVPRPFRDPPSRAAPSARPSPSSWFPAEACSSPSMAADRSRISSPHSTTCSPSTSGESRAQHAGASHIAPASEQSSSWLRKDPSWAMVEKDAWSAAIRNAASEEPPQRRVYNGPVMGNHGESEFGKPLGSGGSGINPKAFDIRPVAPPVRKGLPMPLAPNGLSPFDAPQPRRELPPGADSTLPWHRNPNSVPQQRPANPWNGPVPSPRHRGAF